MLLAACPLWAAAGFIARPSHRQTTPAHRHWVAPVAISIDDAMPDIVFVVAWVGSLAAAAWAQDNGKSAYLASPAPTQPVSAAPPLPPPPPSPEPLTAEGQALRRLLDRPTEFDDSWSALVSSAIAHGPCTPDAPLAHRCASAEKASALDHHLHAHHLQMSSLGAAEEEASSAPASSLQARVAEVRRREDGRRVLVDALQLIVAREFSEARLQPGLQPGLRPGLRLSLQPGLQPGLRAGLQTRVQQRLRPSSRRREALWRQPCATRTCNPCAGRPAAWPAACSLACSLHPRCSRGCDPVPSRPRADVGTTR